MSRLAALYEGVPSGFCPCGDRLPPTKYGGRPRKVCDDCAADYAKIYSAARHQELRAINAVKRAILALSPEDSRGATNTDSNF
jgi:hypothetical protein